jgi:hypothetical protein
MVGDQPLPRRVRWGRMISKEEVVAGYPLAKLSELEQAMAALAQAQLRTETNLDRLESNLDRHATESRANLDRQESNLDRYIAESQAARAEDRARMERFEARLDLANKNAGDALNRVGRLVEDIVGPTLRDLFRELFSWQGPIDSGIRVHRGKDDREFDAYAAAGEHFLVMSAKGTLSAKDITEFLGLLERIREYFPEAANRKAYGALASLYADESVVTAAERRGLYVIGLRPGITTLLNSQGFTPAAF